MSTICHIGIGSNLGDACGNVKHAIQRLGQLDATRLDAQSDLFLTAPIDAVGDDYINAVARIDTQLAPERLLQELQAIERNFGRERPYRNAPRTLDLDILLYGTQTISTASLEIPHPRMAQRAFVLIPLLQLDPFIAIPGYGPAHVLVAGVSGQVMQKI